jgi:hypothetical protein
MYPKRPVVDHFGNLIEVGDAYFYGSPPTAGKVVKINRSSIVLEIAVIQEAMWKGGKVEIIQVEPPLTMTCRSPEKGVCLDKKGFI